MQFVPVISVVDFFFGVTIRMVMAVSVLTLGRSRASGAALCSNDFAPFGADGKIIEGKIMESTANKTKAKGSERGLGIDYSACGARH